MNEPMIAVKIRLSDYPTNDAMNMLDPITSSSSLSGSLQSFNGTMEEALDHFYADVCEITLFTVFDRDVDGFDVELEMEGSTGDADEDSTLLQSIHNTAEREIAQYLDNPPVEDEPEYPDSKEMTIYARSGEATKALVLRQKHLTNIYTFYIVQPKGVPHPVAVLASPNEMYIEERWDRKKPLPPSSVFSNHHKWYDALSSTDIQGKLSDHIHLSTDDVI